MTHDTDAVSEILRRASIAKRICDWSAIRHDSFRAEIVARAAAPATGLHGEYLDPAPFGLDDEFVTSPGPDRLMRPSEQAAMGAWDAERTLRAWRRAPRDLSDAGQDALRGVAFEYLDIRDRRDAELDEECASFAKDFPISEMSRVYHAGDPDAWLRWEHRNAVADGRVGYADILLEPVLAPCVYLRRGSEVEIADGWHRTAAALVTGRESLPVIEIRVPEEEPDLEP